MLGKKSCGHISGLTASLPLNVDKSCYDTINVEAPQVAFQRATCAGLRLIGMFY